MPIPPLLRFPNPLPTTFGGRFSMYVSLLIQTIMVRYPSTTRAQIGNFAIFYLQRTIHRFNRLLEAVANGIVPRPRPQRPGRPSSGIPPIALPTTYGWLLKDLRHEAAVWGGQIEKLLAEPEAIALLEKAPNAGRLLRPICRMLALKPPILYPPKPKPIPKPKPEPAAEAPPDPAPPRVWTIDDLPCPRLATRWPFREVLGKIRT